MTDKRAIDLESNRNVSWMSAPYTWPAYLLILALVGLLLSYFLELGMASAVSVTTGMHGVLQFFWLHWTRGTPFEDQNEHILETTWEQIDAGVPWTDTRKFLLIVPIVLYVATIHVIDYEIYGTVFHSLLLAVLIVAKLPEMHMVRFFGLNRGPVQ